MEKKYLKLYEGRIVEGYVSNIELEIGFYDREDVSSKIEHKETILFQNLTGSYTRMNGNNGKLFRSKKEAANYMLKEAGFECGLDDLK